MKRPNMIDYSGVQNRLRQGGTLSGPQYMSPPYNDNLHNFYFTAPYAKSLGATTAATGGISTGWLVFLGLGAWLLLGKRR